LNRTFWSNDFIPSVFFRQINLDTSLCVDSLLPQIVSHYDKIKDTFKQIDTLENGVKTVERSISSMELELSKAETQLGSESVFKTVFRPFLVTMVFFRLRFFVEILFITYLIVFRNRAVPPPHLRHLALTTQLLSSTQTKFGLLKENHKVLLQTKVYLNHLKSLYNKCHTQGIGGYFKYTRRKKTRQA